MVLTTNKDDLQLIERFFERELTEDELTHFKERLDGDTHFAEQVARFDYARREVEAIYYPDEEKNFKERWGKVLQTPQLQVVKRKTITYYLMRVAAVLVLAIGLIGIGKLGTQEANLQQLAIQNWEQSKKTDMGKVTFRGTDTIPRTDVWKKAKDAYEEEKFETALTMLELLGNEPDALFLKGICHFELRQMNKAIDSFGAVIQHEGGGKKDAARWYQALAYLHENNTDAARKNLNIIIESNYPKAIDRNARQLLEQLGSN